MARDEETEQHDEPTRGPSPLMVTEQNAGAIMEAPTAALSAQAIAAVQARYVMADRRPRSLDQVRVDLLKECRRPNFAAVALYQLPRGGKTIEGPSIRFAEAAMRCMKNVLVEQQTVNETAQARTVRVTVTDLEANVTLYRDVVVEKTVERKRLASGQRPVGQRVNSYGDQVYLVEATSDEIAQKEAALASKAIRTCFLRLLPGDILDEALRTIRETMASEDARDPDATRKGLVDAFAGVGVRAEQLRDYVDHELDACTPAELHELRAVLVALREGEASWAQVVAAREELSKPEAKRDPKLAEVASKVTANLKAQEEKRKAKGAAKPAAPAAPATTTPAPAAGKPEPQPEGREPGSDDK